jgi:hypothetical protein
MTTHALTEHREISPTRVAIVGAGLVAGGAMAGAVAGALGASLWIALTDGLGHAFAPAVWVVAGTVGAAFGAVLLPLTGFTALRRVALGRILVSTILGTALGGALGATAAGQWLGGAIAGFALVTAWLWYRGLRAGPA